MMKSLRRSGREGKMDGIKVVVEMTAEMIACIKSAMLDKVRE